MPQSSKKRKSGRRKHSRHSHPHGNGEQLMESDTGSHRQATIDEFFVEGKDNREPEDCGASAEPMKGEEIVVEREDAMDEPPPPPPLAEEARVEYVEASDVEIEEAEETIADEDRVVEAEPVPAAVGQCLGVTEEVIEAIGDQGLVRECSPVQTETLTEENGAKVVPLQEVTDEEAHQAPIAIEAVHQDPLGPAHRTRWWNCCGVLDLFTGPRI